MIGRIHTIRAGTTGTPVLLLHGIGGAAQSFRAQLPALAARYRAVAWDAPGYGASADPAAAPSMSGYAALAASLLAGLLRAHVVGVSWGGVIATRLAVNHPDRVRSLTLADSSRGSARTPAGAAAMRARAAQLADLGVDEFARRRALRLVAPNTDQSIVDDIRQTMARVRLPGYRFAAESMADTDNGDLLPGITVPTLVVVGAHDQVTGVGESRRLAGAIPAARLRVLDDAGHAANVERPIEFNRLLLDFFDEVDAARRICWTAGRSW